ncbi:MAG: hypothetical protein Q8M92_09025 [Candidatus Subteraquimicrobiales bacterium]|nr:hypothetical protein [Candidatus Subteraquimicrobiales bacterium]
MKYRIFDKIMNKYLSPSELVRIRVSADGVIERAEIITSMGMIGVHINFQWSPDPNLEIEYLQPEDQ